MANTFLLRALTPDRTLLEEEVNMIVVRTVEGDIGILPGHEPCTVMLDSGVMMVHKDEQKEAYIVSGGFMTVEQDKVVVMSSLAERADRMEALLDEMEQQRLKRKADGKKWEGDLTKAERAIRRVLMGQETSTYSILQGVGESGESL